MITNFVYDVPYELPNDLTVRKLGNLETLEKYQIWTDT